MICLVTLAFIGIFFFDVEFPVIVLFARLIGYVSMRKGGTEFAGGGHGPIEGTGDGDSLLDEELPDHAKGSVSYLLSVAGLWLVLWLW